MFPIQSIWDSESHGANIDNADYEYYMGLRNRLKNKNIANLKVPTPSKKIFQCIGSTEIYCLCDAREPVTTINELFYESADKE